MSTGDIERRADQDQRERLSEGERSMAAFVERNDARYERVARGLMLGTVAGVVVFILAVVVWRGQVSSDRRQNDRIAGLVESNARLTQDTARLVRVIVAERARNIRDACEETNRRNARTVERLDRRLAVLVKANPAREAEIRASREFTHDLIDALAPHVEDCAARAREQTQDSTAGP